MKTSYFSYSSSSSKKIAFLNFLTLFSYFTFFTLCTLAITPSSLQAQTEQAQKKSGNGPTNLSQDMNQVNLFLRCQEKGKIFEVSSSIVSSPECRDSIIGKHFTIDKKIILKGLKPELKHIMANDDDLQKIYFSPDGRMLILSGDKYFSVANLSPAKDLIVNHKQNDYEENLIARHSMDHGPELIIGSKNKFQL